MLTQRCKLKPGRRHWRARIWVLSGALLGAAASMPERATTYQCDDGTEVTARYPDERSALLAFGGRNLVLTASPAADGVRYTGKGWQWWTKGMSEAFLAPLSPGETIAGSAGATCRARRR